MNGGQTNATRHYWPLSSVRNSPSGWNTTPCVLSGWCIIAVARVLVLFHLLSPLLLLTRCITESLTDTVGPGSADPRLALISLSQKLAGFSGLRHRARQLEQVPRMRRDCSKPPKANYIAAAWWRRRPDNNGWHSKQWPPESAASLGESRAGSQAMIMLMLMLIPCAQAAAL